MEITTLCIMSSSQLQLYTANGTDGWLASSSTNVSNGLWHSVVAEKVGDTSRLIVDGIAGAYAFAPSLLRTNSPLYIGGLPSEFVKRAYVRRGVYGMQVTHDMQ